LQKDIQKGVVNLNPAVIFNEAQFSEAIQEKLARERVVPILSANIPG
jgi:hypothetical protein